MQEAILLDCNVTRQHTHNYFYQIKHENKCSTKALWTASKACVWKPTKLIIDDVTCNSTTAKVWMLHTFEFTTE